MYRVFLSFILKEKQKQKQNPRQWQITEAENILNSKIRTAIDFTKYVRLTHKLQVQVYGMLDTE